MAPKKLKNKHRKEKLIKAKNVYLLEMGKLDSKQMTEKIANESFNFFIKLMSSYSDYGEKHFYTN